MTEQPDLITWLNTQIEGAEQSVDFVAASCFSDMKLHIEESNKVSTTPEGAAPETVTSSNENWKTCPARNECCKTVYPANCPTCECAHGGTSWCPFQLGCEDGESHCDWPCGRWFAWHDAAQAQAAREKVLDRLTVMEILIDNSRYFSHTISEIDTEYLWNELGVNPRGRKLACKRRESLRSPKQEREP
jgi:hypothetical protein